MAQLGINRELELFMYGHDVVIQLLSQNMTGKEMRPGINHVLLIAEAVSQLEHLIEGLPHAQNAEGLRERPFHRAMGQEYLLACPERGHENGFPRFRELTEN